MDQNAQLLNILLDSTAREDERYDAAMDLADFDGDDVVQALFTVATDRAYRSELEKPVVETKRSSLHPMSQLYDMEYLLQPNR